MAMGSLEVVSGSDEDREAVDGASAVACTELPAVCDWLLPAALLPEAPQPETPQHHTDNAIIIANPLPDNLFLIIYTPFSLAP